MLHLQALQEIAQERFLFPNERYPHLKTFLNRPERTMGVQAAKSVVYPDIVVLQWPEKVVQMLAVVETAATVNVEAASGRWHPFSQAGPLYLFVPVGYVEETKRLCKAQGVRYVGLRTWRHLVGYGNFEITDIETSASGGLEALLPAFLARMLDRRKGSRLE
ncbi:MAG: hypothetical protein Q8P22_00860 [Chloroflexota bacterium]|nr:hypothetical protein [Chloroflexota bacterium]